MKTSIDCAKNKKKPARFGNLAGLLLVATIAVPASGAASSEHSVTFVGCLIDNTCYAGVSPAVAAENTTCAGKDQVRWNGSTAIGQEWTRIANAALLAGKKIVVVPNTSCNGSYPAIDQLHIKQ